jgi:deoxyribose-phosphate aldolase
MADSKPSKIKVSLPLLAKQIDHSLLHPTMTNQEVTDGLRLSATYGVATACIKPYTISLAKEILAGIGVGICAVIGFPHGNSTTKIKVQEAIEAMDEGATEIDMVVNIGMVLSNTPESWAYVQSEIAAINTAVLERRGILKVIFENDFLGPEQIERLCRICTEVGVAFVKTSTGYGFVKRSVPGVDESLYGYSGATDEDLMLMRRTAGPKVQIKAAGGVRTLDDLIRVMALGVTRVGATATKAILEEAKRRGISEDLTEVEVKYAGDGKGGY